MEDQILEDITALRGIGSKIMVAGVGGAGGNAVDHMYEIGIKGVNLVVCNTDLKALEKSPVQHKILLGDGLGAGNVAAEGAKKTIASLDSIRQEFETLGTKMLFIAAGMGGGTGTGASPIIAQLAQEMGILTVAIVSTPHRLEGPERIAQAEAGIEELKKYVDSLIIISNEAINELYGRLTVSEAFDKANDILARAAKGISEIITNKSDLVSVDFSDVCKVMSKSGCAVMGVSTAEGDNRAVDAIDASLSSPLFGNTSIYGAKSVLINFAYAPEKENQLLMSEISAALEKVQSYAGTVDENGHRTNTNIIWGTSVKPELGKKVEVIIIVTGFPDSKIKQLIEGTEEAAKVNLSQPVEHPAGPVVAPKPQMAQPVGGPMNKPAAQSPITIAKPLARQYPEIDQSKVTPAYLRRDVKFITHVAKAKRVLAEEEIQEEKQEAETQSLFK